MAVAAAAPVDDPPAVVVGVDIADGAPVPFDPEQGAAELKGAEDPLEDACAEVVLLLELYKEIDRLHSYAAAPAPEAAGNPPDKGKKAMRLNQSRAPVLKGALMLLFGGWTEYLLGRVGIALRRLRKCTSLDTVVKVVRVMLLFQECAMPGTKEKRELIDWTFKDWFNRVTVARLTEKNNFLNSPHYDTIRDVFARIGVHLEAPAEAQAVLRAGFKMRCVLAHRGASAARFCTGKGCDFRLDSDKPEHLHYKKIGTVVADVLPSGKGVSFRAASVPLRAHLTGEELVVMLNDGNVRAVMEVMRVVAKALEEAIEQAFVNKD